MDFLSTVMNKTENLTQAIGSDGKAQSKFTREVVSRFHNLLVAAPSELAVVAKNILLTPAHLAGATVNLSAATLRYITGIKFFEKIENKLPTATDFVHTVINVIKYALGTLSTLVFGTISPAGNFALHAKNNLIVNKREQDLKATLEKEAKRLAELAKKDAEVAAQKKAQIDALVKKQAETKKQAEEAARRKAEEAARRLAEDEATKKALELEARKAADIAAKLANAAKEISSPDFDSDSFSPSLSPETRSLKDRAKDLSKKTFNAIKTPFVWTADQISSLFRKLFRNSQTSKI